MIRQTTTLPVVTPPSDGSGGSSGPGRYLFLFLEVVLLGSIPVLGFLGFRSLLNTQAGEFVVDPGPNDPGWIAAVEPSPVSLLLDLDQGSVAGAVVLAPIGDDIDGGTVILISGATEFGGLPLAGRTAAEATEAIEQALRLELGAAATLDGAAWDQLLGGRSVELANPDPVVDPDGTVVVEAGRVTVDPVDLAAISGRTPLVTGDPEALEFRRAVLWNTLLDDATFETVVVGDPALQLVASHLAQISNGVHRVEDLPLAGVAIDPVAAEELVRSAVALPRGPEVGARLAVRIIDRTGTNDLEAAARALGGAGFEVVQIANAVTFDEGATQLLLAATGSEDEIARLADLTGAATVPPSLDAEAASTVTLLLGSGASIAPPSE